MDEIIEIQSVGLGKLDNAQHVTFHSRAYDIVNDYEPAKIGIPEPLKVEWKGNLGTEEDINKEVVAETLTKLITEKDTERDRLITYIFKIIRACLYSPETSELKAATELVLVANKYGQLQRESFDRESGHINGLLIDLKKPEYAPHITTLRLTNAVTKLETANSEFEKLFKQSATAVKRSNLPRAAEVRLKTDANYNRVLLMLQAAYLSGAATIDRDMLKKLAHDLNGLIDKTNTAYNKSLAQKKAAKDPKQPKEPKTPKEPKQPKEPKDPKPAPDPKPQPQPDPKPNPKPGGDGDPDVHLPEE